MRILIVSDSHGINGPLRAAILKENPDMLIHLGDSEFNQAEMGRVSQDSMCLRKRQLRHYFICSGACKKRCNIHAQRP